MTRDQKELLDSLRFHTFAAEDVLARLLKSRHVPVPLVRDSQAYGNSDDNEWNDAWKDVIQRRRYVVRRLSCDRGLCLLMRRYREASSAADMKTNL